MDELMFHSSITIGLTSEVNMSVVKRGQAGIRLNVPFTGAFGLSLLNVLLLNKHFLTLDIPSIHTIWFIYYWLIIYQP